MSQFFRIGEFAARAGVTVRTVRYYDRIGLLKPAGHAESGQRLYSEMDYTRLQQILTLKFIGLSLDEIQSLLTSERTGIEHLLERQKQVLRQQVGQLEAVIQTIEQAQRSITASSALDLEQFVTIIKAVNMNTQSDWLAQFMSSEQMEQLAAISQRRSLAEQKRAGEAWKSLFRDVRANMDKDVNDPVVQELVERLDSLLAEYGQDSDDFVNSITNAYAHINTIPDMDDAPPEIRDWAQDLRDAAAFMQKAREARQNLTRS